MPTFPSQSWSPGLPEDGIMGNHLCLSFSHQSRDGAEDADSVSQTSLAPGQAERLLSRAGWVSENAAPRLPISSLTSLVFL